jgi:hypothetical protein
MALSDTPVSVGMAIIMALFYLAEFLGTWAIDHIALVPAKCVPLLLFHVARPHSPRLLFISTIMTHFYLWNVATYSLFQPSLFKVSTRSPDRLQAH